MVNTIVLGIRIDTMIGITVQPQSIETPGTTERSKSAPDVQDSLVSDSV